MSSRILQNHDTKVFIINHIGIIPHTEDFDSQLQVMRIGLDLLTQAHSHDIMKGK